MEEDKIPTNSHSSDRAHPWEKGGGMLTKMKVTPTWGLWLVSAQVYIGWTDMTYLAVESGRNIQNNQSKYHCYETGYPRNRVDLQRKIRPEPCNEARKKRRLGTDDYRPAVRSTPSNNIPLVVKSGDELPARGRGLSY
jgi:hypothetical protein